MTQIVSNPGARVRLLDGMRQVSDTVTATMGVGGRNVGFVDEFGLQRATKDGATVARMITQLEDPVADYGAQLLKKAAAQTARQAGDGTTTSTLLAYCLAEGGLKAVEQGANAVELKRGLEKATERVVNFLKKQARPATSLERLKQIARISTNGDIELADYIVNGLDEVGADGVVTIEDSRYSDTRLDVVQGIKFDRGYKSHHFITDQQTAKTILDDAYILLVDGKLSTHEHVIPAMEFASACGKSLLVIAEDIEGEALSVLIVNTLRKSISACASKAPDFGEKRREILDDIAVLTGAEVVSSERGMPMKDFTGEWLGSARRVIVTNDSTTLVDAGGDPEKIAERANILKARYDLLTSDYEKQRMQDRLGRIAGAVAVVYVSGGNDVEVKERKDRAEDALFAVKSARQEGYLPGGGVSLLQAVSSIGPADIYTNEHQQAGAMLLASVLSRPFSKIMDNAGVSPKEAIDALDYMASNIFNWDVFDPIEKVVKNGDVAGIIDPMKVTRCALENAVAAAGMILLTEAIIINPIKAPEEYMPQM